MLSAGRSFTEPPGLNHSALAQNSTLGNFLPMRSSRSKGVLPMHSRTDLPAGDVAAATANGARGFGAVGVIEPGQILRCRGGAPRVFLQEFDYKGFATQNV